MNGNVYGTSSTLVGRKVNVIDVQVRRGEILEIDPDSVQILYGKNRNKRGQQGYQYRHPMKFRNSKRSGSSSFGYGQERARYVVRYDNGDIENRVHADRIHVLGSSNLTLETHAVLKASSASRKTHGAEHEPVTGDACLVMQPVGLGKLRRLFLAEDRDREGFVSASRFVDIITTGVACDLSHEQMTALLHCMCPGLMHGNQSGLSKAAEKSGF